MKNIKKLGGYFAYGIWLICAVMILIILGNVIMNFQDYVPLNGGSPWIQYPIMIVLALVLLFLISMLGYLLFLLISSTFFDKTYDSKSSIF